MIQVEDRAARLRNALHDVNDPEFPISIVDMGLLVGLQENGAHVDVQITLTSMGCPALEMIVDDIRERLLREPGVERVGVEIVWDPIWTKHRLTEEGKAALRELGISL
jgi:metal-sulfur cluster biosynthetic enzyme